VLTAILILLPATYVIGVAALVVRFALSSGDERLQLKWFAAAVVAVAFQPARQRAGRLANRVVYGKRATPYQVLSQFAQRIPACRTGPNAPPAGPAESCT
jgi:hypothetical protein